MHLVSAIPRILIILLIPPQKNSTSTQTLTMPNPSNKGMDKSPNAAQHQRNHFTRTHSGKLKLTHQDGVEKDMPDNVSKNGNEEMKRNMYDYEGEPALWCSSLISPKEREEDFYALKNNYQRSEDCAKMVRFIEQRF